MGSPIIMKTQAIIPAAGLGTRLKSKTVKPLIALDGRPMIVHALEVFQKSPLVESVIVATAETLRREFDSVVKKYRLTKVTKIIAGGPTRCVSVRHGLDVLDQDTKLVVIHDGVRPLVSRKILEEAIALSYKEPAVIAAVPIKPTVKRIDLESMTVVETLARESIWEIQTPQVFHKDIILKAHAQAQGLTPTDDASLVERLGIKVKVLLGDYKNIKITTEEDLVMVQALLSGRLGIDKS